MDEKNKLLKSFLSQIPLIIFFIGIIAFWIFWWFIKKIDNNTDHTPIDNQNSWNVDNNSWNNILTWIASTWWSVISLTWIDITGYEMTDIDIYQQYFNDWNYRKFNPPVQWWSSSNDYTTNTSLMNTYMANNTFKFTLPKKITNWYLYIKIKKPTDRDVFLYWYNSKQGDSSYPVSGNIRKDKSLIEWSRTEFLYKLNKVYLDPYYKWSSGIFDWQVQMQAWPNNFIAWFVKDFNGNQIVEMTIAWE